MKKIYKPKSIYNISSKKKRRIVSFAHKSKLVNSRLLYNIDNKNKDIRKVNNHRAFYITNRLAYILLVVLLLLAYILFNTVDTSIYYLNEDIFNNNVYYNDVKTDLDSNMNNLNKSSHISWGRCDVTKSMYIEHNKNKNANNFNDSIILNKVKDLLLKESITNNKKVAYANLIKDIEVIIKEFKPK